MDVISLDGDFISQIVIAMCSRLSSMAILSAIRVIVCPGTDSGRDSSVRSLCLRMTVKATFLNPPVTPRPRPPSYNRPVSLAADSSINARPIISKIKPTPNTI